MVCAHEAAPRVASQVKTFVTLLNQREGHWDITFATAYLDDADAVQCTNPRGSKGARGGAA